MVTLVVRLEVVSWRLARKDAEPAMDLGAVAVEQVNLELYCLLEALFVAYSAQVDHRTHCFLLV